MAHRGKIENNENNRQIEEESGKHIKRQEIGIYKEMLKRQGKARERERVVDRENQKNEGKTYKNKQKD